MTVFQLHLISMSNKTECVYCQKVAWVDHCAKLVCGHETCAECNDPKLERRIHHEFQCLFAVDLEGRCKECKVSLTSSREFNAHAKLGCARAQYRSAVTQVLAAIDSIGSPSSCDDKMRTLAKCAEGLLSATNHVSEIPHQNLLALQTVAETLTRPRTERNETKQQQEQEEIPATPERPARKRGREVLKEIMLTPVEAKKPVEYMPWVDLQQASTMAAPVSPDQEIRMQDVDDLDFSQDVVLETPLKRPRTFSKGAPCRTCGYSGKCKVCIARLRAESREIEEDDPIESFASA